jgi:F-type H+-transporting ATPase subunit b
MAWFLIFFVVVFVLMSRVFVPRIGGAIADREARIAGDVAEARRLKNEAETQAEAAATERAQARAASQKLAQEARAKVQAESAARLAEEEAKLAETTGKAEAGIAAARAQAMTNVRDIAADTAQAIVEKLTGLTASGGEIAAAEAAK